MSALSELVPSSWATALAGELQKPYFASLERFVEGERAAHAVFPPHADVLAALARTPLERVRVVLLGQDPYHDEGQAHGLCFSVSHGVRPPPSLVNMFKELETDVGVARPKHGHLGAWADQGVLLLNTVLTVRAHSPASHKGRGWEPFTDAVLARVNELPERVVFALFGADAQKKAKLVDTTKHVVVARAHPSPLSARRGFLGSRPFSAINAVLREAGREAIDWGLPAALT